MESEVSYHATTLCMRYLPSRISDLRRDHVDQTRAADMPGPLDAEQWPPKLSGGCTVFYAVLSIDITAGNFPQPNHMGRQILSMRLGALTT